VRTVWVDIAQHWLLAASAVLQRYSRPVVEELDGSYQGVQTTNIFKFERKERWSESVSFELESHCTSEVTSGNAIANEVIRMT
jgi:hypothetical protein